MKMQSMRWMIAIVCVALIGTAAGAAVYEDFEAPLSNEKWSDTDSSGLFTVANGTMTMAQSGFYSAKDIQTVTAPTFSLNNVSAANPFEWSIEMTDLTGNASSGSQNYFIMRLVDSTDEVVAGFLWAYIDDSSGLQLRIHAGDEEQKRISSPFYSWAGSGTVGMRVTDTAVTFLRNGSASESSWTQAFPDGYSIPTEDLSLKVVFTGPDDGGTLTVDNLDVTAVPEPATMALIALGAAMGLSRRRRNR